LEALLENVETRFFAQPYPSIERLMGEPIRDEARWARADMQIERAKEG